MCVCVRVYVCECEFAHDISFQPTHISRQLLCEKAKEKQKFSSIKLLTFSLPGLISLVHDREQEVLIPVSRGKDNGVIQKLINGVQ